MKSVLFLSQSQFGSLIDYYQYSIFLKEKYQINYVCWDYKRSKIEIEGVKVHYISRDGNIIKRNLRFIYTSYKIMKTHSFDRAFIHYFRGCSILSILMLKDENIFLDVRTASVAKSRLKRKLFNLTLRFESLFFKHISVVSQGVKTHLGLRKKSKIIPLGANVVDTDFTRSEGIHLIYIGTLSNRNIHESIEGVALFLSQNINVPIRYTIIGTGDKESMAKIQSTIIRNNLNQIVHLVGYVNHDKLLNYLKHANVGVSYVPITEYYNFQPVTKTYEYLLAGLPVIATETFENKLIIKPYSGVLIKDNPASFCQGLNKLQNTIEHFDKNKVKSELSDNKWENITSNLEEYLLNPNALI